MPSPLPATTSEPIRASQYQRPRKDRLSRRLPAGVRQSSFPLAQASALALALSSPLVHAQTWTGAGSNSLWSNPANWSGGVPINNTASTLSFDFGTSSNDFAGTFGLYAISHTPTAVGTTTLRGGPLSFNRTEVGFGAIASTNLSGTANATLRIFNALQSPLPMYAYLASNTTVDLAGSTSFTGSGGLFVSGTGSLLFSGQNNVLSALTVDSGAQVYLSSGASTFSSSSAPPNVRLDAGTLRPGFGSPTVGNLSFSTGSIVRAALGTSVTVSGNINAYQGFGSLSGPITLTTGPHVLSLSLNYDPGNRLPTPLINLNSSIDGPGTLLITGSTVTFSASVNDPGTLTYTGATSLFNSEVSVAASGILSPASPLFMDPASTLTFSGTTQAIPSVYSLGSLVAKSATLTVGSAGPFPGTSNDFIGGTFSSFNAQINKVGTGTLRVDPAPQDFFSRAAFYNISAGTLVLTPSSFPNVYGSVTVNPGTTLRLEAPASSPPVTVDTFLLGSGAVAVDAPSGLTLTSNLFISFYGSLTVSRGEVAFQGVNGSTQIFSNSGSITVAATGSLRVPSSVSVSVPILVQGTVTAAGALTGGATVASGGLLRGALPTDPVAITGANTATSVRLNSGGALSPASASQPYSITSATFDAGSILLIDVEGGTSPATPLLAERIIVTSSLNLSNSSSTSRIVVRLLADPATTAFDPSRPYLWPILTGPGSIFTSSNVSRFTLDASDLATDFSVTTGQFGLVSSDSRSLYVSYFPSVVPEPSTVGAVTLGVSMLALCRFRRSGTTKL